METLNLNGIDYIKKEDAELISVSNGDIQSIFLWANMLFVEPETKE